MVSLELGRIFIEWNYIHSRKNVQSIYVMLDFDSDSYRGSLSSQDISRLRFLSAHIKQMYPTLRVTTVKGRVTSSHLTIAILENGPVLLFWFWYFTTSVLKNVCRLFSGELRPEWKFSTYRDKSCRKKNQSDYGDCSHHDGFFLRHDSNIVHFSGKIFHTFGCLTLKMLQDLQ